MKKVLVSLVLALCLIMSCAFGAWAETADTADDAEETAVTEAADTDESHDDAASDTDQTEAEGSDTSETTTEETTEETNEEAAEETTQAASPSWVQQAFKKFGEQKWYTIAIILLLFTAGLFVYLQRSGSWTPARAVALAGVFALGVVLIIVSLVQFINSKDYEAEIGIWPYIIAVFALLAIMLIIMLTDKVKWNARSVAYAAMCIAISYVLSLIRLYRMPQGGSITPAAMLPLIMFALSFGAPKGLVVGCAFGLVDLINDPYVIHPIQLLVDYPMAYGALALGCLVNLIPVKERVKLPIAVILAYIGRFIMAVISGVIFFSSNSQDQSPIIYSMIYNVSYLGPDMVFAFIISLIPGFDRILRSMKSKAKA